MEKEIVYNALKDILDHRISEIKGTLVGNKESLKSESKSTAGDKHNTSRAMMHLEEEKLGKQLAQLAQLKKVLHGINPKVKHDKVSLGSLIETNTGWLFIGVSLGKVVVDETDLMAISLASPIGQALKGSGKGDEVSFNGRTFKVISIA